MNLLIAFLIGMLSFPVMIKLIEKAQRRINSGTPVKVDGEVVGHIIVVRYGGVKRFASCLEYVVGTRAYYDKESARQEVINRWSGREMCTLEQGAHHSLRLI